MSLDMVLDPLEGGLSAPGVSSGLLWGTDSPRRSSGNDRYCSASVSTGAVVTLGITGAPDLWA